MKSNGREKRYTVKRRENSWGARWYEIEPGFELPSVTTVLSVLGKPALVPWAAKTERELVREASASLYDDLAGTPKMKRLAYLATLDARLGKERAYKKELSAAAEIGTAAHKLIEWNLRRELGQHVGPEPKVGERSLWAFMAFEDWKRSVDLKPVTMEQTVYSRNHGYAGTLDLLAEVKGIVTLVDFKTSKAIYPEASLQLAAYAIALEEMGHWKAEQGMVVRLPKAESDPAFETLTVEPFADLFPLFLSALQLWKWMQIQEAKRTKPKKETIDPDPLGLEGYPKQAGAA
jgi:hypothetical protein